MAAHRQSASAVCAPGNRYESLRGKVALVTGASGDIGRALAIGLAASGADVVAVGRRQAAISRLGEELTAAHDVSFKAVVGDLCDTETAERIAEEAWRWHDGVDIVVNAAGVILRSAAEQTTPAEWDDTFAVNVRGTFLLTQRLGERMLAGVGGSIVNITSLAGHAVTGAPITYGASKAALIYITRYLAVRWAPKVRVNAVAPGYIRTSLNEQWLEEESNQRYVLDHTPMRRVGSPEDVLEAVLFLASPGAGFITGQNLGVDGGWSSQ
jgi:2-deoxy-D-gluconate 3-dehydrogenase